VRILHEPEQVRGRVHVAHYSMRRP
jgi:hypothetical protein